ncbi:MAG: hypothetical protein ACREGR_01750 [Minisyncoccia bacterium]
MQTNIVVFEKDGKQYPESKEALERSQAHERSRQKQEAADRVREARYNLGEAEKQLASLEEPDGTAT